ncbi:MAG: hydroxylamine dehydrogenase haoA [Nitrospira sp.]|nr:MAG: hydroxylamine dehydrogenase haoA [Nitrospira sp.]
MKSKLWVRCVLALSGVLLAGTAQADFPSVPKETYEALKLDRSASPKELHGALTARYLDPAEGFGKGKYGQYWEPLPFSKYLDPGSFYKPPTSVKDIATREQCVKCHTDESPGWVTLWKKSSHANLDKIRKLTPKDDTYYKKAKLEDVETNLRSLGKLGAKEQLKEVGCIDCHVDINTKKKADHRADLRMPTADTCGNCHLQEYAERESERDTITWPKDQWPKGRPSHALDYRANVEVEVYAGMSQREIADGCTMCHVQQNKCDGCHTRHEFSVANSRKPEACGTCHSGADHINWEAYTMSKHGKEYESKGNKWNWNVQLKDAIAKGGQDAPTCQSCHMEYQGKFSHNVVRKVRWANYPFVPGIRENIKTEWADKRLDAWVKTCTTCHSERYARAYLEFMDNGTYSGLDKYDEAHDVVHKQYEEGLLTGQKDNRPKPPAPVPPGFEQFFQIYWSKGNNPAAIELKLFEMAEDHLVQLHVSLAHQHWGYTYTVGWAALNRAYVEIMDEDTKLKEKLALMERVDKLEGKKSSLLDLDGTGGKITLGSLGGGMLLTGGIALVGWSRRKKNNGR